MDEWRERTERARASFLSIDQAVRGRCGPWNNSTQHLYARVPEWEARRAAYQQAVDAEDKEYHRRRLVAEKEARARLREYEESKRGRNEQRASIGATG